jgi:signal transduction histidine kinase
MQSLADEPQTRSPALLPYVGVGVALLVVVLMVVAGITLIVPQETGELVGSGALLIGNTTAAVIIIRRARRLEGAERRPWVLIGSGFLVATLGVLVVGVIDVVVGGIRAFGPADFLFFAGYVVVLTGLATLPQASGSVLRRSRVVLDALIGAVALGALLWVGVMSGLGERLSAAPPWERFVATAYPFLDLAVIVALMVVAVRRSSFQFDLRILLLSMAVGAQALGDITFLESGVGRSFEEAEPVLVFFLIASILLLATSQIVDRPPAPRESPERKLPVWAMLGPYTAALVMLALLVITARTDALTTDGRVLFFASLIVGGLVIGRQAMAIRENQIIVDRERATLISSISHELRTPLTSMVGFLDILGEDDQLDAATRDEMVGIVSHQANYMARIVSDLVMLARGSAGDIRLREIPVNIGEQIRSAIHSIDVDPETVAIEVPRDLIATVDPDRVQQVLVNLLSNSVRYGGGKRLVVARRLGADLVIEVHDNGPGVPRRYELLIWERFERGPNRLNATTPGSGIGLAIVDAVARAHSGSTAYRKSERLGGACFAVELPGRILDARDLSALPLLGELDADVPSIEDHRRTA